MNANTVPSTPCRPRLRLLRGSSATPTDPMSPAPSQPEETPEAGVPELEDGLEGSLGAGAPTDHELVQRAQAGDEAAYADLVGRHEERAVRVALSLVANREDARDLAQEAFLRVFRNIDRFDFKHEFTTWLYRIVTNLAIDHLRKRRPAMSTSSADEEEADLDLVDPSEELPSAEMERRETADRVRACIDRLAPHFRTVMVLRELEGLPCTKIAEIVGATHVTVRWRLHRGRKLFLAEWERMESQERTQRELAQEEWRKSGGIAESWGEPSNPPKNAP